MKSQNYTCNSLKTGELEFLEEKFLFTYLFMIHSLLQGNISEALASELLENLKQITSELPENLQEMFSRYDTHGDL